MIGSDIQYKSIFRLNQLQNRKETCRLTNCSKYAQEKKQLYNWQPRIFSKNIALKEGTRVYFNNIVLTDQRQLENQEESGFSFAIASQPFHNSKLQQIFRDHFSIPLKLIFFKFSQFSINPHIPRVYGKLPKVIIIQQNFP